MATGKIDRHGFGTVVSSVTLPYTAISDCIVNILIRAQSVTNAGAYIYFYRNGSLYSGWNGSANGGRASISFPLKSGDSLSIQGQNNIQELNYRIFPLS